MSPPSSSTIERSEKYHSCYQLQHYRQVKGFIHVITINFNNISDMYHSVNPNSDNHIFYMSSNIRHVCLVDFRSADATREGTPTRLGEGRPSPTLSLRLSGPVQPGELAPWITSEADKYIHKNTVVF